MTPLLRGTGGGDPLDRLATQMAAAVDAQIVTARQAKLALGQAALDRVGRGDLVTEPSRRGGAHAMRRAFGLETP